ncbi:MAG: hypothetical protein LBT73_03120 [Tannerellaceae bacterium]|jgi:hypothetical protein|nr:hypothetical protein [Tannerellaceae bacterium]
MAIIGFLFGLLLFWISSCWFVRILLNRIQDEKFRQYLISIIKEATKKETTQMWWEEEKEKEDKTTKE